MYLFKKFVFLGSSFSLNEILIAAGLIVVGIIWLAVFTYWLVKNNRKKSKILTDPKTKKKNV